MYVLEARGRVFREVCEAAMPGFCLPFKGATHGDEGTYYIHQQSASLIHPEDNGYRIRQIPGANGMRTSEVSHSEYGRFLILPPWRLEMAMSTCR